MGTVNFSSAGGIVSVPVTLNVSTQPAKFTVAPQSLSFNYEQGSAANPAAQGLAISACLRRHIHGNGIEHR